MFIMYYVFYWVLDLKDELAMFFIFEKFVIQRKKLYKWNKDIK